MYIKKEQKICNNIFLFRGYVWKYCCIHFRFCPISEALLTLQYTCVSSRHSRKFNTLLKLRKELNKEKFTSWTNIFGEIFLKNI